MSAPLPPIIIIKKKGGHGGHHGGAWKVAYADFVTAMMALFIVLWLMNSSVKVQKAISSYFRDPSGSGKLEGSASAGSGESVSVTKDDMTNLKEKLQNAIKKSPELEAFKDNVKMSVTGEGLRVELIESERGMFFDSGSPHPTGAGTEMIEKLAQELGKLPNQLLIEGHTDAKPFSSKGDYSNWELSTDRANAARRLMDTKGLRPDQVVEVRGFAAERLRDKEHPEDPSNRRITVIVKYQEPTKEEIAAAEKEALAAEKKEGGEKKEGEEKKEGGEKKEAAKKKE